MLTPDTAGVDRKLVEPRSNESQLRESEERFRLMLEGIVDYAIYVTDPEGRITNWSVGAERTMGYPAEAILGEHLSKFYLPADRDRGKPEYELRIAADKGRVEDEGWRVRQDGAMFWARASTTALRDQATGQLRGFARVTRDLTLSYRNAIATLADGVVFLGPEGRVFACNDSACRILEMPESLLIGRVALYPPHHGIREDGSAFPPEDYPPFVTLSTGSKCSDMIVGLARPGTDPTWVSVSSQPLATDPFGKPSGVVLALHDITKLKNSQNLARRGEELFRSLVEATAEVVWSGEPDGAIRDVSAAFEQLTGLSRWHACEWRWLDVLHPDDREAALTHWKRGVAAKKLFEMEYRIRMRGDVYRYFHIRGLPLLTAEGAVREWIGTWADVHERVIHEERLEHKANFDALTGLANRGLLNDRLLHAIAHAGRTNSQLGLLFMDIDHFKNINDSLGHQQGDEVLQEFAKRLIAATRAADTVARIGGDEFVVILATLGKSEDVLHFRRKFLELLYAPILPAEQEMRVTVSIGAAIYPHDGETPEALLAHADAAMYRAKEKGRDSIAFYSPDVAAPYQGRQQAV